MSSAYPITYTRFESGRWETIPAETIVEQPVALTVNGELWTTFMCTPVDTEAMMVGFLFNEKVIESMAEVVEVRTCEHGDNVDVWLTHPAEKPAKWTRTSGCTGGVTAIATEEPDWPELLGGQLASAQVGRLVEMLFEAQALYKETGGVHTSALSDGEKVLLSAEDIGRHNTLDKIAGLWLMRGGSWEAGKPLVLMTTGRISSEMLQKAGRMRAAVLISRTSPSSLSIQMAAQRGITLIGYARRHRFNVYTHQGRVSPA